MEKHDALPETYIRRRMNKLNHEFEQADDLRREVRKATSLFDRDIYAPRFIRLGIASRLTHLSNHLNSSKYIHISYAIIMCHQAGMTMRQIGLAMGLIINKTDQQRFAETLDCLWGGDS